MDNKEFREIQDRKGWDNPAMADFLGYSVSAVVKLRRDGTTIPTPVARCLRMYMAALDIIEKRRQQRRSLTELQPLIDAIK